MSIYLGMLAHPTDGTDDIKEGIYLRWASHYKFGFPSSGYRLYRKKSKEENFHCYSDKQLKNLISISKKESEDLIDINLPEESSHVIIDYHRDRLSDFKVIAFNNDTVHWEKLIKDSNQKVREIGSNTKFSQTYGIIKAGKIDIVSGKINRIVIIAKYVKINAICYYMCSDDDWKLINDECGLGLPFNTQLDAKLRKKLIAISKDPCDPYWGMAICRLGQMDCNFKGQNFQDLKDMISEMAGEGIDIPIGWNEFNVDEDGLSCEEEVSPEFGISHYDVLLTQSLNPEIAMILGLYWIDKKVEDGIYYDYKIEAEWAEDALFKLEHEFTFDEEETGKSFFPLFHQTLRKDNLLFQGIKPRILDVSSSFAKVERGLAFNYPNNSTFRIIFDKPVKEVQIFIQQEGLQTRLRAYSSWSGGSIIESILSQKEGVLSVHSNNIKHLVLEGKGIVILRLHYDFEELPRGMHSFCICGIKKLPQEKLAIPTGVRATCLRGAVTDVDDNCNETEYRFRAGLRWDYAGNLNNGLLTNGPVGYFLNRLDLRGNNELLNEGDPIFVIPEDLSEGENQSEIQRISDCRGNPIEERPYYSDAVLEKGTYYYKVQSFDIFGRKSDFSEEASVELKPSLPPPPINVRAKFLDYDSYDPEEDLFKDPTLLIEEKQWLREKERNGFLIKWSWPYNLQKQAPDATRFKIRFFAGWLNVYQGIVNNVNNDIINNEIKITLAFNTDNHPLEQTLINEWIKIGSMTYKIIDITVGDVPVLILRGITEEMVLPEDISNIQLTNGDSFSLSVSKAIQEGGAAINYNDPANWGDTFHEESIEVPSITEYSVFLPVPDDIEFPNYSNNRIVYGQIAINTFSEDNNGDMSIPATVIAVNRQSLESPGLINNHQIVIEASKADFYGKSTYKLEWLEDNNLRYNIYRCMDQTLFMVDKRNRESRDTALYTEVINKMSLIDIDIDEDSFSDPDLDYISLIDDENYILLRAIACLPDNQEAFGKLNDNPLKDVNSYLDQSLDGLSNNFYFYKIRSIDEIGNQGDFSISTPPIKTPKVTAPVVPVITKIAGGQKQIIIKWSGNPGSGIIGYLVYRTDDPIKSKDWRKMDKLLKEIDDDYSVEVTNDLLENNQYEYVDETVVAKVKYYYTIIAICLGHNDQRLKSKMSVVKMSQAFDDSVPEPPEWKAISRNIDGINEKIALEWLTREKLGFIVLRKSSDGFAAKPITDWQDGGEYDETEQKWSYSFEDNDISSRLKYTYFIKVRGKNNFSVKSNASDEV